MRPDYEPRRSVESAANHHVKAPVYSLLHCHRLARFGTRDYRGKIRPHDAVVGSARLRPTHHKLIDDVVVVQGGSGVVSKPLNVSCARARPATSMNSD